MRRHLRARHVPPVLLGFALLVVVGALAAQWLAGSACFGGAPARVPVVVLVPLLSAVLGSATLTGADLDLEATTPRLSRTWRAGHGLTASLGGAVVVACSATADPWVFGSWSLARNTLGLTGLVLLGVVVLPAALSWAPALVYTLTVYLAAPRRSTTASTWWAWPMQDGRPDGSWVVALALVTGGVLGYALAGPAGVSSATHSTWWVIGKRSKARSADSV